MACNICSCNPCCCSTTNLARYSGPDINDLGIRTGDLLEVVIQNITTYITNGGSGAVSSLVDNGNGTYTHDDGETPGTAVTFTTGTHTSSLIAPLSPNYGDTWYDITSGKLKWFTNNGTIDIWASINAGQERFKEETVHHNVATLLSVDPSIHNKRELHFESTGDMTLDGNLHLLADDFTYLLVNTTAVDRLLAFTNIAQVDLRDGGALTNLALSGITIKSNTSLLVTVTNTVGTVSVNGHFPITSASGDASYLRDYIFSIVAGVPYVLNVPSMTELESLKINTSSKEDITDGIKYTVVGANITFESNVSLTNIEVRAIISI